MKIAMIGAGHFAQAHLRVLSQEPGVEIVGHVSRTPARREAAALSWGGNPYEDCEQLLLNEEVEAAWVVVPPAAHGEIEECLIEAGVPFFVEKPLSADRGTAERIGSMVAASGLIAAVGYHWRAMDVIPEVRRALATRPPRLVLAAWHGGTPPPTWWQRQEESGGQMVEQATHLFDIARHLVGEARVVAATADRHEREAYPQMDVADTSTAVLEFEGGAKGVVTATCLLDGAEEVYVKFVCDGLLVTLLRDGAVFEQGRERRFVRRSGNPVESEDRAFLRALRENDASRLYCSYEDALRTHRLCFDVLESAGG